MSKEIVDGIRNAIEEAQRAKNSREEREAARKQTAELAREEQQRALIARNEERLRATGIVALFEELRDSKVLTMNKEGDPTTIEWNSDKKGISIEFDQHHLRGSFLQEVVDRLEARISGSGELQIGEHVMKQGEELANVVKNEILRIKGLRE